MGFAKVGPATFYNDPQHIGTAKGHQIVMGSDGVLRTDTGLSFDLAGFGSLEWVSDGWDGVWVEFKLFPPILTPDLMLKLVEAYEFFDALGLKVKVV